MKTAINIIGEAVNRTDTALRGFFGVSQPFIHFESGYTSTIVNSLLNLSASTQYDPFPLIAVFTEGMRETQTDSFVEFTIPKIIIAIRTCEILSESQRLEVSFAHVLHPIYVEFARQLQQQHFGYNLHLPRSDVPYYTESSSQTHKLNAQLDGIIINNVSMRVLQAQNS